MADLRNGSITKILIAGLITAFIAREGCLWTKFDTFEVRLREQESLLRALICKMDPDKCLRQ